MRFSPFKAMQVHPVLSKFEYVVVWVDDQGRAVGSKDCQAQFFEESLGHGINLEMILIPEGIFQIQAFDIAAEGGKERGSIPVSRFCIGKYPVTQSQWSIVAHFPKVDRELNPTPSRFQGTNRPVEQISWHDAMEFCARLTKKTGREYRLPSEVEWEYACRAGTYSPFHFGEVITIDLANYNGEEQSINRLMCKGSGCKAHEETTEVGHFRQVTNAFGLYDMHGNVWEWCSRYYIENPTKPVDSWVLSSCDEGGKSPLRGGSWQSPPKACCSNFHLCLRPTDRKPSVGFRVVCSLMDGEHPDPVIPSQLDRIEQQIKTMSEKPKVQMIFKAPVTNAAGNVEGDFVVTNSNQDFESLISDLEQVISHLKQKYPNTSDPSRATAIIEAEYKEIKRTQPWRWQNFLSLKRLQNGSKNAALKIGEHFAQENPWGKGVIGFLEGVSEDLE